MMTVLSLSLLSTHILSWTTNSRPIRGLTLTATQTEHAFSDFVSAKKPLGFGLVPTCSVSVSFRF
jgi:hypothetical protein